MSDKSPRPGEKPEEFRLRMFETFGGDDIPWFSPDEVVGMLSRNKDEINEIISRHEKGLNDEVRKMLEEIKKEDRAKRFKRIKGFFSKYKKELGVIGIFIAGIGTDNALRWWLL